MPYNPQSKLQSNWCQEILAKFVKQQEISQNQADSEISVDGMQIAEGKWEDHQNLKFVVFIDFYAKIFASKHKRKSQKIFKSLSQHLGNRTPAQCRSHYQKVMIKFKTIAKLKKYFKEYFGEELYNTEFKSFTQSWLKQHPEPIKNNAPQLPKQVKEIAVQTETVFETTPEFQHLWMMWQMQQWQMSFFQQQTNFWVGQKAAEE